MNKEIKYIFVFGDGSVYSIVVKRNKIIYKRITSIYQMKNIHNVYHSDEKFSTLDTTLNWYKEKYKDYILINRGE